MYIIISIILIGVFLWLCNLGIFDFGRDWPVILIVLGCCSLLTLFKKSRKNRIIRDLEKGKISAEKAEELLKHGEK